MTIVLVFIEIRMIKKCHFTFINYWTANFFKHFN